MKKTNYQYRGIKKGQLFIGNSKGIKALWVVTRSIKTDEIQQIYCKAIKKIKINRGRLAYQNLPDKMEQSKNYSRKQFGFFIYKKFIELVA